MQIYIDPYMKKEPFYSSQTIYDQLHFVMPLLHYGDMLVNLIIN